MFMAFDQTTCSFSQSVETLSTKTTWRSVEFGAVGALVAQAAVGVLLSGPPAHERE